MRHRHGRIFSVTALVGALLMSAVPVTSFAGSGIIALEAGHIASQKGTNSAAPTAHHTLMKETRFMHPNTTTGLKQRMQSAMHNVSSLYGIPYGLLHAISMTESGTWPWTLNVYGVPYYFSNARQTITAVHRFLRQNIRLIDIGPMQVDWQYHGWHFGTVSAAVNPLRNIAVAGRILVKDYQLTGSWRRAVGLYHGGGPGRQFRYIQKVFSHWTAPQISASPIVTVALQGTHWPSAAIPASSSIVALQSPL